MPHSVLVVDDRPEITQVLTQLLEADNRFSLDGTAGDGVEAIEHTQRGCPDAIILDVEVPRMDGLEALPLLRKTCPDSVIVRYTSHPSRTKPAPQLGADASVDKAEDPIALLDLLVDLCRTK
jgi:chemotaxis response regulator CheB